MWEVGRGAGDIAEYVSDRTGARITGLDYAARAIEAARTRTLDKAERLVFMHGGMNALALAAAGFDTVVSIDTLYFVDDLERTIATLLPALKPESGMGPYQQDVVV